MLVMSNIDNNATDDNRCSKLVKDKSKYRKCKNSRAVASLYCNLHLSLAIKSENATSKVKDDKQIPKESSKPQSIAQKYTYSSQCKFIKSIGEYKIRCRVMKLDSSDYCKQHSTAQTLKKSTVATSTEKNTASKVAKNETIKGKLKEKERIRVIKREKSAGKKLEKGEVATSSVEMMISKDKKVGKAASSVKKTKLKIDKKSKITDYITKPNVGEQATSEICSKSDSYKASNESSTELEKHKSTSLVEIKNMLGISFLRLESYLNTTTLTDSIRFSKRFDNYKAKKTLEVEDSRNSDGDGNDDGNDDGDDDDDDDDSDGDNNGDGDSNNNGDDDGDGDGNDNGDDNGDGDGDGNSKGNSNSIGFSKDDIEYKLIEDIQINKKERIDFRELNRYNRNSINFIKIYRDF